MLASKAALGLRVDSLSDWGQSGEGKLAEPTEEEKRALGVNARLTIERRLRNLEGKPLRPTGANNVGPGGAPKPGKWEVKEARKYNPDADGLAGDEPAAMVCSMSSTAPALATDCMSVSLIPHSSRSRARLTLGRSGRPARSSATHAGSGAIGTRSGSGK